MWSVARPYYYPSFTTVLLQLYLTDLDIQEGDDCQFDYIEVCICFVEIVSKVYGEGHDTRYMYTVELQWLEHRWLIYHGHFKLAVESLAKIIP